MKNGLNRASWGRGSEEQAPFPDDDRKHGPLLAIADK
ncbi:hypothetical protein SAMN05192563_1001492 [Paraburkholderia aspalathi]|uniref:Uncharacterized protein n=1 Tax=Paraburkholderia aspalathi TaxID=1324617 RepID=A0A1I6YGU0_9BURK|nr:hypothetical protein SAMN05192563_1001492 [Paraburkholderia aspalathi]